MWAMIRVCCAVIIVWIVDGGIQLHAQETWPGGAGSEIGRMGQPDGLPAGYEPSGAVWHAGREHLLLVGDGGQFTELDADGHILATWTPGGDLEAVAVVDPEGPLVYLGLEHPDSVLQFDLGSGTLTGESWDLTPWMSGPENQGLEALTLVDDLFYAGHQGEGNIYTFQLMAGGSVIHVGTIAAPFGRTDLSGLDYDGETGTLYAIHDGEDVIVEMTAEGNLIREYDLAGDNQEGIALDDTCPSVCSRIFIAEDAGEVWRYETYPLHCSTVSALLECHPTSGTLPLDTFMTVTINNLSASQSRRLAGRLDVHLAGGVLISNWKSGWGNVAAGENLQRAWNQTIPSLGGLVGATVFTLEAEDVTPAPYNQPPYPFSGDTDSDGCIVTGVR